MICTIFFFNSISSVATPANPPALALWASWLMLLASPASFRQYVRIRLADALYYFTRKQYGVDEH